jgi:hypothetical protein
MKPKNLRLCRRKAFKAAATKVRRTSLGGRSVDTIARDSGVPVRVVRKILATENESAK